MGNQHSAACSANSTSRPKIWIPPGGLLHLSTANGGPVGIRKLLQIVHVNKNQRLSKTHPFQWFTKKNEKLPQNETPFFFNTLETHVFF